jgi:uncharacterized repeat protein (TIGR01451 family)
MSQVCPNYYIYSHLPAILLALAGLLSGAPAIAQTPPEDLPPDLVLAKDDGGISAGPGDVVPYTLDWSNPSQGLGLLVVLTETVPEHSTFEPTASEAGWQCTPDGSAGSTCTLVIGTVPAGGSGSAVFAVRPVVPLPAGVSELVNTGFILDVDIQRQAEPDSNPDNNTATDTTPLVGFAPDLAVTKSDQGATIEPGGTVVYHLTYRNTGPRHAAGVVLSETVPEHTAYAPGASGAGWSCDGSGDAGSTCTFSVGDLPGAGTSGETTFAVTLTATLPAGVTEIVNTATIADDGAGGPDAHPADNSATETTPITGAAPELSVAKDLDPASNPQPGGVLIWSLTYANTGNQGTAGVVLHETVPAHTTFRPQGSDPRWICSGTSTGAACALELGEVPAGGSGAVPFAVTVDTPLPAGVEATENCAQLGSAESCHIAALDAAPDLALIKDDGGVTVRPGGVVTYTLTAVNHGNQDADGVAVTDRLPAGTVFSAEGSSPGWTCSVEPPGAPVCSIVLGPILAGGSRTATLALTAGEATGGTMLTNTATVTDDGTGGADPTPDDNTASDTTPVEEPPPPPTEPRLEVDLSDEPFDLDGDGLGAGDAITYIVFVRNVGGATAEEVVFVVEPDPHTGLLADSVIASQGDVLEGQGPDDARVAVALGALEAAGSATSPSF